MTRATPSSTPRSSVELQRELGDRVLRRGRLFVVLVLLGLVVCLGRVVQLKVMPEAPLRAYLDPPTSSHRELGRRGDLVDTRGRILATSVKGHALFVDPTVVEDLGAMAEALSPAAAMHPQEILQRINGVLAKRPGSRYVLLSRRLEDWQVDAVRQLQLPGVGLEPRLERLYPQGEAGASLIGFVDIDHRGRGGAEGRLEELLAPTPGRLTYLRDAGGRVLFIDDDGFQPKRDGEQVRLSVDMVVQEYVEERLGQAAAEFNARGARCVVMDAATGDILAISDVLRTRRGFLEVIPDDARDVHPAQGRNRCVTDPFEPGSTFKPFVWAAALDQRKARPEEILPLPNGLYTTSRGRAIRDVKSYGPVSWERVLVKSLNSGMALVGERFTAAQLREAVTRFGFGETTRCGVPGEIRGRVTPLRNWTHYSQTSVPMGQEIAVTMVQMVRAFSAFCRDGTIVDPRLYLPPPGTELATIERRALPEAVALRTRDVMRKVMGEEGTGRYAQSERYSIFGKTGTPQLPIPKAMERKVGRKGYFQDRYIANFIGGAPAEHPRIVVYVTIDDPDRRVKHFGGVTAAPVARDIVDFTLGYLGVEPDLDAEPARVAGR